MNVDERARQAARRLHQQAGQLDTDALLVRIEARGTRTRWFAPALAAAVVLAVVVLSGIAVSQLLQRGPNGPIIDEPDRLPSGEPSVDASVEGSEPRPEAGQGRTGPWQRVPHGEVFGVAGTDEQITGIANMGGTTVAVGASGERAGIWVRDPDRVAEETEAWSRIDGSQLCAEWSCTLTDVTVAVDRFVAVGSLDGQAMAWTSQDGQDWQRSTITNDGEHPSGRRELVSVAFREGLVVALGNELAGPIRPVAVMSSDGGTTWETVDMGVSSETEVDVFIADMIAAPFGFVAVGGGGDVLNIWRSETGRDWKRFGPRNVQGPPQIGGLATLGGGVVFLGGAGDDAAAWRSPDGETWQRLGGELPGAGSQVMRAAAYVGGRFVAVGEDSRRADSHERWPAAWVFDGEHWRVLDGGDAFKAPGSILAASEQDGHSLIAAGFASERSASGDAAVWTYTAPEGPAEDDGTCSAAGLEQPGQQSGLPEAVAAKRGEIALAALACDLDALGAIASGGDHPFTYSFGDGNGPVSFWWRLEEEGHQPPGPTWWIVRLLDLPHATVETQFVADEHTTVYVWPSAFAEDDHNSEAWRLLVQEGLYTEQDLEMFREVGGYIGYRIGITEDGEWVFFVAGD